MAYDSNRRAPRKHNRVVRRGSELFEMDGVKLDPSDFQNSIQKSEDDDQRILTQLPPHWAIFNEHID